jgi:hypothetical protein
MRDAPNGLVAAPREEQEVWLLARFPDLNMDGLIARAYPIAYGAFCHFDQGLFSDMTSEPGDYDLGDQLRERMPELTEARAEQINAGATLSSTELAQTRALVIDGQLEGDGGFFCSGFDVPTDAGDTVFASFIGRSLGQGGIGYAFDGLFANREAAERSYRDGPGDRIWIEI